MSFSRREFLKNCSLIGAAVASYNQALFAREPHLHFPTRPADRLSLTSWPFRAYFATSANRYHDASKKGMDMKDFAAMAVQKFNIHNINPVFAHFRSTDTRYLDEVREATAKAGSHFADLGLGHGNFYDSDASERQAAIAEGKKGIDAAVILGSPSVRQHIAGKRGTKPDVDLAAQSLGELADYGSRKNIVVILENDNPVSEDPFFIVKVIEKVGNPYLRALPDLGNSLQRGDYDFNARGVAAMFEHAFNMSHVKDVSISRSGTVYPVHLAKLFGIAKAKGYRGYFSMEWEGKGDDPFEGTQKLIKETLQYLS